MRGVDVKSVLLFLSVLVISYMAACSNSSESQQTDNTGLKVTYSNGVEKVEKIIHHGWRQECGDTGNNFYGGACLAIDASPVDWAWGNFDATWSGSIFIPVEGEYTFSAWVDGAVYIMVNDSVVADFNTVGSAYTKTLSFAEAKWYPISMKFIANGGSNYMHLGWVKPGTPYETVPAENLRQQ